MEKSLFIEYIEKFFKGIVGKITEKINGKPKEQQLLHKTMLTEEYSADLSWGSSELDTSIVAADVVSMDSSLPLKSRDKVSSAHGTIPKIGIKYKKGEKAISDINVMKAKGVNEQTVASKIFNDVQKVIKGIQVRIEIMFLQALSTGYTLVDDPDNVGTGIRVNFGYKDENTFHAKKAKWGNSTATPQDDVQQLFDKADEDGNSIGLVLISKKYFNYFRQSEQGITMAALYQQRIITDNTKLPVPSRSLMLEALEDEYGVPFRIIDASFKVERTNGSKVTVRPWKEGNIVAIPSENVGRVVYGTLAEETNPVSGVSYQKSGSYILVAEFSKTDPLQEFTTGQALALPVIDGGESIYVLHADSTLDLELDKTSLIFSKEAGSQTVNVVHTDSKVTASADQTWCKPSVKNGVITVKVEANSSAERTANVTVTDKEGNSVKVTVTQATGTE